MVLKKSERMLSIGIMDSGIGGLTVLKKGMEIMPYENFIYYADTDNAPYGTKPKMLVKRHIFEAVDYIVSQGIKALLIACNTATSIAVEGLRKKYDFPVLGMEPAVKPAIRNNGSGKRVMVAATPLTLKEDKFNNLVSKEDEGQIVDCIALPKLVEMAENMNFKDEIVAGYLKSVFRDYDLKKYGTIVLGCTHFPFFKPSFKKVLPQGVDIIDGSDGTVKHLYNVLVRSRLNKTGGKGGCSFHVSGRPADKEQESEIFSLLMQLPG